MSASNRSFSTKALIFAHSWSLKMSLQSTLLKSAKKKRFWFFFFFFLTVFLACTKFLSFFDSSSMNFDNWYAATMLPKKQQAAEPRSERVTAGEACWSRAPTRNQGVVGETGEGGQGCLSFWNSFSLGFRRAASKVLPSTETLGAPRISHLTWRLQNWNGENTRLSRPHQTAWCCQDKRSIVETNACFVFFFSPPFLKRTRTPNRAAPLIAINPNFTDCGSKSTFGEPRKLTGEDSLPSLAGAHQKVRQRVATVPMEDKLFFFAEENKETWKEERARDSSGDGGMAERLNSKRAWILKKVPSAPVQILEKEPGLNAATNSMRSWLHENICFASQFPLPLAVWLRRIHPKHFGCVLQRLLLTIELEAPVQAKTIMADFIWNSFAMIDL